MLESKMNMRKLTIAFKQFQYFSLSFQQYIPTLMALSLSQVTMVAYDLNKVQNIMLCSHTHAVS